jgi:hypothetical protein
MRKNNPTWGSADYMNEAKIISKDVGFRRQWRRSQHPHPLVTIGDHCAKRPLLRKNPGEERIRSEKTNPLQPSLAIDILPNEAK